MFVVGGAAAALAIISATIASGGGESSILARLVAVGCALVALYGIGMGGYMTYGSRIGKLRARERLLDLAGTVKPWTGREQVLDVGCGRGLMLVGAARRLTSGQAVGVDLWHAEDQTDNVQSAAIDNARLEGCADRVRVETGDARSLPFEDQAFDVVLSHWVVHNLPTTGDRERALCEMLRVLRPGGMLLLADIAHHSTYRNVLHRHGLSDLRDDGIRSPIIGILSGGSFRPRALIGRKPV